MHIFLSAFWYIVLQSTHIVQCDCASVSELSPCGTFLFVTYLTAYIHLLCALSNLGTLVIYPQLSAVFT